MIMIHDNACSFHTQTFSMFITSKFTLRSDYNIMKTLTVIHSNPYILLYLFITVTNQVEREALRISIQGPEQ